jgi:saccharopine dehydrogenase-like NADP-dependent oxidoreductase
MTATLLILGAGGVGSAAATFAGEQAFVGQLIVADYDIVAARAALAASEREGEAIAIDVTDTYALARLMGRTDAVINCVGPYYRFGIPVLKAAIEAGTTYLDVCDDWDATLDMLALDDRARAAGVTAIIGMGASPGTANMIAAMVANAVGTPRTLITGWSLDDDPGDPGGAANEHWLHQATGRIRVWREGRYVDEKPLQRVPVAYPGLPPRDALTIGHPEAVTLPLRFPTLDTCLNLMTLPGGLEQVLEKAASLVETGEHSLLDASYLAFAQYVPGAGPQRPIYPGVWAIAEGDGARAAAHMPDYGLMIDMQTVTAAPSVAALGLVLAGKTSRNGVLAPEEAFEPADYFTALATLAGVGAPMVEMVVERS